MAAKKVSGKKSSKKGGKTPFQTGPADQAVKAKKSSKKK